jgi:iron-sulfur cluster repair protein YtfE (RIC family)
MRHIKSYLARDHRDCDELLSAVEEAASTTCWTEAQSNANSLVSALSAHFAKEEQVLFPYFEGDDKTMAQVTAGLRAEHARMLSLARLLASATAWRDPRSVYDAAHSFYCVMVHHNENEERNLFTMSDELLGAQADRLIAQMEAVAGSVQGEQQ